MILEIYFALLKMYYAYGALQSTLIIGFLTSLPVFAAAAASKLAADRLKAGPWYLAAFVATQVWFFLGQTLAAIIEAAEMPLALFFQPATIVFVLFVAPMAMAYRRMMARWPMLPWHLMIYLISLLCSIVLWYMLIYHFQVFVLV